MKEQLIKWLYEAGHNLSRYFSDLPKKTKFKLIDYFLRIKKFIKHFSLQRYKEKTVQFIKRPLLPFILYKMLVRSFLYWSGIAQGLFIVIFLIFDFFSKIDNYINSSVTAFNIIYITVLLIPKGLWMTMPVAIMFGIIMSLSSFYQDNELIAIFTSGISIYKFIIPVILINIFLSVFMIFIDSSLVIPSFRYRENLFEHLTNSKKEGVDMTIHGEDNFFWNVEKFVTSKNMLQNILIFKITDDYRVIYRIDAASAVFTKTGWLFSTGTIREWDSSGDMISEVKFTKKVIPELKEKPSVFKNIFKKSDYDIEKMTISEARDRINLLKKLGIDRNEELTNYYKKFSFPFTLVIICLFSIGVSTLSQKNILILALFFSIGLAIIYYVAQMILDVLASSGKIPPLIGAWLPIFIFIPISLYLVRKAKT